MGGGKKIVPLLFSTRSSFLPGGLLVGPFFSLDDDVTMTRCRRRRSGRACCYCIGVPKLLL